jgi:hypothetical protein
MCSRSLHGSAAAVVLLFVSGAHAQTSPPVGLADPLNAKAAVAPLVHRSALATYKSLGETRVGSWKDANETVNRIGGWRVYAREANLPDGASADPNQATRPATPAAAPTAPAPTPASSPASAPSSPATTRPAQPHGVHGGHGSHGKP